MLYAQRTFSLLGELILCCIFSGFVVYKAFLNAYSCSNCLYNNLMS